MATPKTQEYFKNEKIKIQKMIDEKSIPTKENPNPGWKTVRRVGSCEEVRNGARLPKKQSVSYRNRVKGKYAPRLRVHQAVMIMKEGKLPIWRRIQHIAAQFRMTISHICGRSLCKNEAHLELEDLKTNLERCKCHDYMKEHNLTNHCLFESHDPPCFYNH